MTREEMRFRRLAVAEAARTGSNPREIAKKFHLSLVGVYKICAREGVQIGEHSSPAARGGGK